ncbi:MAG TPA: hypothetical protein VGF13_20385, partial [Verrucomicrobiae bacterium]
MNTVFWPGGFLIVLFASSSLLRGAKPLADTIGASNVTVTAANLHGLVTPKTAKTKTWFEWGLTTNYGQLTATQTLASGGIPLPVQQSLNGLSPVTTYQFRVVAKNSDGTRRGTNVSFTTEGLLPTTYTETPTSITTNSARLRGSINPNGLATSFHFEWGISTNYGSVTGPQSAGAGNGFVAVQADLNSLLTGTNYHYRLVASNSAGVSYGSNVIVTPTLLLYLYAGESWSYAFHDLPFLYSAHTGFGSFSIVRFNVEVLPGSFAPGSSVRLDISGPGFGTTILNAPATGTNCVGTGGLNPLPQGVATITVLTGSVVIASAGFSLDAYLGSGNWSYYANTITPTRNPQPPSLGTQFVSSVSIQSAVISADIDARNLSSGLFVQWGTTTNYSFITGSLSANFDYLVRRDITVSNLAPGTTYHFRVGATNIAGTNYGNDIVATTLSPATVVTLPASNRKTTSATLNATVSINGLAATNYFEWGPTASYGQITSLQNLGSPVTVTNIAAPITGLSPQTTYNYRAVVFSAGVTNLGSNVVFITPPPPTNLVVTNLATDDVRGVIERGGSVIFACDGVLVLSNQIEIANDVSLDASGHSITFSGGNTSRIFSVSSGAFLVMTNLTLAHGLATDAGGALHSQGIVSAYDCRFISNAIVATAGIAGTNGLDGTNSPVQSQNTPGRPGGAGGDGLNAAGGAIFSSGSLTLTRCLFATNAALGGKGGAGEMGGRGGQSSIFNPLYHQPGGSGGNGGAGGKAQGGAVASFGLLRIDGCTFSNSVAPGGIGGKAGAGGFQQS